MVQDFFLEPSIFVKLIWVLTCESILKEDETNGSG